MNQVELLRAIAEKSYWIARERPTLTVGEAVGDIASSLADEIEQQEAAEADRHDEIMNSINPWGQE